MRLQLLLVEDADSAPFLLDGMFVGQVVKNARDRLPTERKRRRHLVLREIDRRLVALGRLVQQEVRDLLVSRLAGQLPDSLVGPVERVGEQAQPAKADFREELFERRDRVKAKAKDGCRAST